MGDLNIVLAVTGASGFVGRACVAETRRQGLPVIALYRRVPCPEWTGDEGVTAVQLDLGSAYAADRLTEVLDGAGAVIHAAAHLGDDPDRIARDTKAATGNALEAGQRTGLRVVLISSIAVYDMDRLSPGDTLTEASPLIAPSGDIRDPYAASKRQQEAMMAANGDGEDDWILRPGAVWGPGRSWHALQGFWASKLFVTIGSDGELPLCHVDHLARTAVDCARTYSPGVSVLNVFDDDKPTRARFLRAHKRVFGWPGLNVTVPYGVWRGMVRLLKPISKSLPGLFQDPILRARMMPLRYSNATRQSAFTTEDIDTFEGMMSRAAQGTR